jgi:hypothetical protein
MSTAELTTQSPVEYREIDRFVGYRFGDDGSCWSRWKHIYPGGRSGSTSILTDSWRIVPDYFTDDGYRMVGLKTVDYPRGKPFRLHRLILEVFKGPCPSGLECCHRPGASRSSCRLEDLRWDTREANHADRIADGTDPSGERGSSAKLTWKKVDRIRQLRCQGMTLVAIAAQYGVSHPTVSKICRGKNWIRRP